jgi:hypothetical protein
MRGGAVGLLVCLAAAPATATAQEARGPLLSTLDDLGRHVVRACRDPRLEAAGIAVTVRFSLRADGTLLGRPKVTKIEAPPGVNDPPEIYEREVEAALLTCMPVPISAGLGRALAGRTLLHRFGRGARDVPKPAMRGA